MQRLSRPKAGLSPAEALKKWSAPEQYEAMEELSDAANRVSKDNMQRHFEYSRRRDALENAFIERLKRGEIFCSAIPEYCDDREIIKPAMWAVLAIEYEFDRVGGNKRMYEVAEFFEPHQIPANIIEIPEWLRMYTAEPEEMDEFSADDSYRHVRIRGRDFTLGSVQAAVIRQLREASLVNGGWMNGKLLLMNAGSTQTKMSDLFKPKDRWSALIESDRRGAYRLNLTRR